MKTKRYIQTLVLLMLCSVSMQGQVYNELSVKNVNGMRGKIISVPVYLDNSSEITSLQFDIQLPNGNNYQIFPDSSVIASNRNVDHIITGVNRGSARTRFMLYSPTNTPLRGNSGKLCDVVFRIPTNLDDTQAYDIQLSNVSMSDKNGQEVFTGSTDAKLTLVSYPDFEVSNLTVTNAQITPGGTLTMSWTVKNIGETASTGGWKENFYLVNDEGTTVFVGSNSFENSGIAPGGSVSRSITVTLPTLLGIDGTVNAKVSIKGNSDSGERSEQEWNNSATAKTGVILNRTLTLTLPTSNIIENRGQNVRLQLTRSGNKTVEETFNITHDNASRIEMPATVTIGRNQSSVTFYANVTDNDVYDEDSVVHITASKTGYESASGQLIIEDNEYPDLTLTTSKEAVNEGETLKLTVSRPKARNYPVEVSFTSETPKLFEFPSTVTIPANKTSADINVQVIDNDLPEVETATAFYATATKFNKAKCIINKLDDDMPEIELRISPSTISENYGPACVSAVLTRKTLTDKEVVITLSDDSDGDVYYSTKRITMAAGVTTAEFTLGAVDNVNVDGDRTVNITAGVYARSCSCSATGTVTGASTVQLTILDNDGPTLTLKTNKSSLVEGQTNAAILTVTRNTGTSGTTTVTLSSDHDEDLTYNKTATIPNGSASVDIPISVKANSTPDDERTVVFTVKANGYSQGTCIALITDQSVPDATITSLTVANENVSTLGKTDISVTIENVGNQPLQSQAPVNIYMRRDGETTLLTTIYTQSAINAGESGTTTKNVTMPDKAGEFNLYAVVNEDRKLRELIYVNNTSSQVPLHLHPSFTATLTTDKSVYIQDERIGVTGNVSGSKISNVDVEVYFINNNTRKTETVSTDAQGNFTLSYNTQSIGGHYIIGACYPDERLNEAMAEVDVYGLRRTTYELRKNQPTVGFAWNDEISITNSCPLRQTNITAEVLSDNDDIEFSFTPVASLDGNGQTTFKYSILPTKASTGDQWNQMKVRVKSAEGAYFDFIVYYFNRSPKGKIKAEVTRINSTMVKGQSRDYPLKITNTGNGATGKISLVLPNTNWLTSVTPLELPSMETTDTTTIILRFTPTDDMPLNVPITGTIGINCETGDGISLPFSIEPVSESTGRLTVDVTDEYSYYTDEQPHVEGAKVKITHPTTGALIAEGTTDSNGHFTVDAIPEGYYSLYVTADRHDSYRNNILVDPGKDNTEEVFLSFQAISVSWDVVETEVEDVYEIVTTVKYETNVPAPVVTVKGETNLTSIQKLNVGESEIYYYTYTNEGLISALNFRFSPIGDADGISGDFKYEILNAPPLELAPQQEYVAALKITRISNGAKKRNVRMKANEGEGGGGRKLNCMQYLVAAYEYFCKQMNTRGVTEPLQIDTDCAKFLNGYVGGGESSGPGPVGNPGGSSTYTGGGGMYGTWGTNSQCPENSEKKLNKQMKVIIDGGTIIVKNIPYTKPIVDVYEHMNNVEKKYKEYKDWWDKSKEKMKKEKMNFGNFMGTIVSQNPLVKDVENQLFGNPITSDPNEAGEVFYERLKNTLDQMSKDDNLRQQLGNLLDNAGDKMDNVKDLLNLYNDFKELDQVMKESDPTISNHTPSKKRGIIRQQASLRKASETIPPAYVLLGDAIVLMECHVKNLEAILTEFYGDEKWVGCTFKSLRTLGYAIYDAMQDDVVEFDELTDSKPENISEEDLQRLVERLNNSMTDTDAANQMNYDNLATYMDNILYLHSYAVGRGYDGLHGMFDAALKACDDYDSRPGGGSVCASVTLQINQTMTMTRQAFRGTLSVENNSSAGEMKDVRLKLEVTDVDGNVATAHEFQINAESLDGFEGEVSLDKNWTLAQGAKGVATILFIPTKYAAETEDKVYYFGGTLSYIDPATELSVTRELTPVSLTVKPSPNLNLTYFMQRDIFGDDPLTLDVVEPIVPAEFALLIDNEGYGDATNVRMVTNQPEIVENEKGLLVDFQFTSSQLNGKEKVLSLGQSIPTDFGTIPSRGTSYAQWWLECSLLGHFVEYEVSATHVTSYGNEDLTLLNNVTIHELIRSVNAKSVTGEPLKGWLVNDEIDANDYPDIIYLSDATTEHVNMLRSADIQYTSNNQYKMTVVPSDAGWNYGNVIDPTRGRQTIERVLRADGTEVDLQNIWQTDRTLIDGQEPLYENRIHIADKFANGGSQDYTIVFSPRPEIVLMVDSIGGIPTDGTVLMDAIQDITLGFNKPVLESTLKDNIRLTCQGQHVDEKPTVTKIDDRTFKFKWAQATNESGYFTITAYTSRITDKEGYKGDYDYKSSWNQVVGAITMMNIHVTPVDAGTTTPESGEQTYNETVTLKATPAYGYVFKDWLLDDEVYSTDATTTYKVEGNAMFIAEFEPKKFEVTVDESSMAGTVSGAGTGKYDYKSEITLTAKPLEGYRFLHWIVNGETVSTETAYTFKVQGPTTIRSVSTETMSSGVKGRAPSASGVTEVELVYEPTVVMVSNTYDFAEGWNWFSINPLNPEFLTTSTLLESVGMKYVDEIRGKNGVLKNENGVWKGDLTTLSPGESYQLKLKEARSIGIPVNKSNAGVSFTLSRGWNNVGYMPYEALDINTALTNWDAKPNDVVKSQDAFAVFDGTEWKGTLTTMEPGKGYQFYSHAVTTFYYPTTPLSETKNNTSAYEYDSFVQENPDNMVMLAVVSDSTNTYVGEEYDLTVKVNNKKSGVATCVDDLYYLIIYGEKGKRIRFDFQDHKSKTGYYSLTTFTVIPTLTVNKNHPSMIYIKEYSVGDVNRDGTVDISDIVAVINTIAGDETYKSTADVNGDKKIDISDIVAIINIIASM